MKHLLTFSLPVKSVSLQHQYYHLLRNLTAVCLLDKNILIKLWLTTETLSVKIPAVKWLFLFICVFSNSYSVLIQLAEWSNLDSEISMSEVIFWVLLLLPSLLLHLCAMPTSLWPDILKHKPERFLCPREFIDLLHYGWKYTVDIDALLSSP